MAHCCPPGARPPSACVARVLAYGTCHGATTELTGAGTLPRLRAWRRREKSEGCGRSPRGDPGESAGGYQGVDERPFRIGPGYSRLNGERGARANVTA